MRIVVAGAGVAGLTLAVLLRRQGHEVVLVEQRESAADPGYALALWPHGTRVLHAVGVHDQVVAASRPMGRYTARDGRGRVLTSSPLPQLLDEFGHVGIVSRGDLLRALESAVDVPVRYGAGVRAVTQTAGSVRVALADGGVEDADLLVGADGIGSRVRGAVLGPVPQRDTGWACLVWWSDGDLGDPDETVERWGSGTFIGTYPCRERVCVIAGAPRGVLDGPDRRRRAHRVLGAHGLDEVVWRDALDRGEDEDVHLWPMADVRAPAWVRGRTVLVGDAAAAFLPTAGIGASMALEGAAALADELSRTDARHLPSALRLYERRRRARTERAQRLSRRLARFMFVGSRQASAVRDVLLARTSIDTFVRPLVRDLQQPI
ncbi:FAD-dependent oxidoreductase [Nocardioides sp. GXQ0305]|uniref:FAD-dependent oxidoreductase n=1 Tax=Nocardioides sp. GXQ0305 TaxID=3423912 RepID=UPI003D7C6EA7